MACTNSTKVRSPHTIARDGLEPQTVPRHLTTINGSEIRGMLRIHIWFRHVRPGSPSVMMSIDTEKPRLKTLSVPEAGERLGICRNSAYAAAKRGEIPT